MSFALPGVGPSPILPNLASPLMSPQAPVPSAGDPGRVPRGRQKPKRKKPDPNILLAHIDEAKNMWQELDARMDEDIAYWRLETGESLASGNFILRNTPRVMVDKAAQIAVNAKSTIDVVPAKNLYRELAQKEEDFCRFMWDEWNRRWQNGGKNSLEWDAGWYGAGRGWISGRMRYDPEVGPEELPTKMTLVDPRQIYPVWDEGALNYVAHIYKQTAAQAMSSFPDHAEDILKNLVGTGSEDDLDLTQFVSVKAYYDDWWWAVFVDDVNVVEPTDHQYGRVPWIVRPIGGSPVEATEDDTEQWVRHKGPAIFESIKIAYDYGNKILSMLADEIERQTNPPMLHKINPQNKGERPDIELDPGAVNFVYSDESLEPMYVGPQPAQAGPLTNMLTEDIEKGSLPSSLWALAGDGISGFQQALSMSAGRDALAALFEGMTYFKRECLSFSLMLIRDHHDSDVGYFVQGPNGDWISGETISPDEIRQVGTNVQVKFKDVSPQDKQAWANLAVALTQSQLVSRETARERYLDIENPLREEELVVAEMIAMNPQIMENVLIPQALAGVDPQQLAAYLMMQQMQAQQPAPMPGAPPGGPMPPGLPPGVMPPQMQPGADGLPMDLLMQAAGSSAGGQGRQRPPGVPGAGALPVRLPL